MNRECLGITPPKGGKIIRVSALVAQLPWKEAVQRVGGQNVNGEEIWTVGRKNPRSKSKAEKRKFILLCYPHCGGNFNNAVSWARENGLGMTSARDVFAIGADKNFVLRTFRAVQICTVIASTSFMGCDGRSSCSIWRSRRKKGAGVMIINSFGDSGEWIAFVEKTEGEAGSGV